LLVQLKSLAPSWICCPVNCPAFWHTSVNNFLTSCLDNATSSIKVQSSQEVTIPLLNTPWGKSHCTSSGSVHDVMYKTQPDGPPCSVICAKAFVA
jgi:hypothetical protein